MELRKISEKELKEILDKHIKWLRNDADGKRADLSYYDLNGIDLSYNNLSGINLSGCNLRGCDLRGANLDYSVLPLWCGSFDIKVDKRIAQQIAYHFCRLDCDDPEYQKVKEYLIEFANGFHRAEECGILSTVSRK